MARAVCEHGRIWYGHCLTCDAPLPRHPPHVLSLIEQMLEDDLKEALDRMAEEERVWAAKHGAT